MASTFTPTVITSNSGVNNVFTNIPLANSATTTIQNISTFANGEGGVLTGVIKIDATTDYVFGFEISFTKDTAGVINHSVRYFAGDIPTLALFTIGVSGQDIQITLGTHAGFVNSSARFQMMASAASPGVQVSARNVTGDTTGTAPGAGLIGEKITPTAIPPSETITTTEALWTNGNIVLTPGRWQIFAHLTLEAVSGSTAGNNTLALARLRQTNLVGALVGNEERGVRAKSVNNAGINVVSCVTLSEIVTISTNTTYVITVQRQEAGSGNATILNQTSYRSNFYAIRIA